MNKDEALDLALEALIYASSYCDTYDAITAIKQARALDKMAENARELGLDYEPVQEPVAWVEKNGDLVWQNYEAAIGRNLYTTPPAAHPAPVQPVAKPKLIGWRTADFLNETTDIKQARNWEVHYEVMPIFEGDPNTKLTTPPAAHPAPVQEPVAWCRASFIEDDDGRQIGTDEPEIAWGKEPPDESGWSPLYTTPPVYDQGWKDGYKHGAWANTAAPVQKPEQWEHLKAYGYAPGNYMMTCRGCNTEVIGVDKRASRCKPCAIKAAAQPAPVQEPVKLVAYNCKCGRTMKFESVNGVVAAQRQWVGLTDEQRTQIRREHYARTLPLMDAVEAALKENNT